MEKEGLVMAGWVRIYVIREVGAAKSHRRRRQTRDAVHTVLGVRETGSTDLSFWQPGSRVCVCVCFRDKGGGKDGMGPRWMSPEARIERTRACFDVVVCRQLTTASAVADFLIIRGRVGASDVEGEWAYAGICALPLGVVANLGGPAEDRLPVGTCRPADSNLVRSKVPGALAGSTSPARIHTHTHTHTGRNRRRLTCLPWQERDQGRTERGVREVQTAAGDRRRGPRSRGQGRGPRVNKVQLDGRLRACWEMPWCKLQVQQATSRFRTGWAGVQDTREECPALGIQENCTIDRKLTGALGIQGEEEQV